MSALALQGVLVARPVRLAWPNGWPPVRPSLLAWLALLPLMGVLLQHGPAQAAGAEDEGRQWLSRMKAAALGGNYQGTLVYSAGGTMSSSRVWHFSVGDSIFEMVEAQDGRQQNTLRHNDEVRTVWPRTRTAVVERREALANWATTPQPVDTHAADNYELRREGSARVAGREAAVLLAAPRDALRFAQRLWADVVSGLMLRADVLGPDGRPLESTAFSSIEMGVKPQPERIVQEMRQDEGLRVLRPVQRRTRLEDEGWNLVRPVKGFALAGCVLRGPTPATPATPGAGAGTQPVLQAVFFDGLTYVSVFVERFDAQRHHDELQAQVGATFTVMRRAGEHWITAVGDVPVASLKLFVESLERRR